MNVKICTICKIEKNVNEYYPLKAKTARSLGVRSRCKECERTLKLNAYSKEKRSAYYQNNKNDSLAQSQAFYAKHKNEIREYGNKYYRERRKNQLERDVLYRCRSRAKLRDLEFNLTIDDIVIPKLCPILNIKLLTYEDGISSKRGPKQNSPSIDRIDPTKGYVKGNVRIISHRANTLKSDASIEEIQAILLDLITIQKQRNS